MCIHLKDNCLKSYRSIHKSSLHLSKSVFCFLSPPYLLLFSLLLPLFFSNQCSSQNSLTGKVNHLYSHEKVKIPYLSTTVFLSSLYLPLFSFIAPIPTILLCLLFLFQPVSIRTHWNIIISIVIIKSSFY